MKTLFCLSNLEDLGAQRAIIWIINHWPKSAGEIALSLHERKGRLTEFVDPAVTIFELDRIHKPIKKLAVISRVRAYYDLIASKKPETVIAVHQFDALALCLIKRFIPNFRLVVCEHCHVSANLADPEAYSGWFKWYYRLFFRHEYMNHADIVMTVSHEAADDLNGRHGIPREKIRVIYNPVDIERIRRLAKESVDHPWFDAPRPIVVSVSRLVGQKRIDILIEAWKLATRRPDWPRNARLIVVGEGPHRHDLEALRDRLGLRDEIDFVGFQANPWKWMQRATLFISTSIWEGLPCSLIEAHALGLPVISSDCPSGPKEILLNGKAGFLFPSGSVEGCADVLSAALGSESARHSRRENADRHIERFDLNSIVGQYVGLVQ